MKKMLIYLLLIIVALIILTFAYMQHPKFGAQAKGARLLKMENAANYKNGQFHNVEYTPSLAEGYTYWDIFKDMWRDTTANTKPSQPIKHILTDINSLDSNQAQLVWLGHSTYYITISGKKFLVDPVLSGAASPIASLMPAFNGADIIKPADIPAIDFLIITHDHFDHLDYETIKIIKDKVDKVICPLGVGAHFELWGFDTSRIIEKNWDESAVLNDEFTIHFTTARHFSGRTFKRNTTLWTSYVLSTPKLKLFLGGDSGYGKHFKEIGAKHGPFDWVILENGQYNKKWHYIHAMPEEQINIITELQAKNVLTVHHAKFKLANHEWKEPLVSIHNNAQNASFRLATPQIGEILLLEDSTQTFEKWWEHN